MFMQSLNNFGIFNLYSFSSLGLNCKFTGFFSSGSFCQIYRLTGQMRFEKPKPRYGQTSFM